MLPPPAGKLPSVLTCRNPRSCSSPRAVLMISGVADSAGGAGVRVWSASTFGGSTRSSTATHPDSFRSARHAHAYQRGVALPATVISLNAPTLSMTGLLTRMISRPPPSYSGAGGDFIANSLICLSASRYRPGRSPTLYLLVRSGRRRSGCVAGATLDASGDVVVVVVGAAPSSAVQSRMTTAGGAARRDMSVAP